MSATLFVSIGMASYIAAYKDEIDPAKINLILKDLWQTSKHVRNLGLAVGHKLKWWLENYVSRGMDSHYLDYLVAQDKILHKQAELLFKSNTISYSQIILALIIGLICALAHTTKS